MPPKPPLGRGLQALLPTEGIPETPKKTPPETATDTLEKKEASAPIGQLPVKDIRPNPFQPRRDFEPVALDELKRSILEKGVIQPITVRRAEKGGYELISGERRWRATIEAGIPEIPAYILDVRSDREMLELALIENIQREKLNPVEVALGYKRLMEECGLNQEEIATRVGKDRTTVTNFIRLLRLPEDILLSVRTGELTMGHARALLALDSPEHLRLIWRNILEQGHSVRKTESLVSKALKEARTSPPVSPPPIAKPVLGVPEMEAALRARVATKVKIDHTAKGSGQIIIEYYSEDELERLMELFTSLPT